MKFDLVNRNGESFCVFAEDGSFFDGLDSREEAEYNLECINELDDKYGIDNGWSIVEV